MRSDAKNQRDLSDMSRVPDHPAARVRIGIDTLFEDPVKGSSALDYLISTVRNLASIDHHNQYYVFCSPSNRRLFEVDQENLTFVNCFFSNENRALRIMAQQVVEPYWARKYQLDIVFAPGNVAPLFLRCPSVVKINTLHHYLMPSRIGWSRSFYRRLMMAASARLADRVIANTSSTKSDICRLMGLPEEKVLVVPEAVDEAFLPEGSESDLNHRLKNNFELNPGYILFVSDLYRYKNADRLIRAYSELTRRQHARIPPLVIVGGDPDGIKGHLELLAEACKVSERTRFMGRVPNASMPDLYRGASALVYPSLSETFGKPLVEAMRCKTPIVASDVGPIPEMLAGSGLLVSPDDTVGLADAIDTILTDKALARSLVEKGLRRGRDFSWHRSVSETLAICLDTARRRAS